jgi:hypothetical protein
MIARYTATIAVSLTREQDVKDKFRIIFDHHIKRMIEELKGNQIEVPEFQVIRTRRGKL